MPIVIINALLINYKASNTLGIVGNTTIIIVMRYWMLRMLFIT
jgi:hypothetical protein